MGDINQNYKGNILPTFNSVAQHYTGDLSAPYGRLRMTKTDVILSIVEESAMENGLRPNLQGELLAIKSYISQ